MTRIGPKMIVATQYVSENPGTVMHGPAAAAHEACRNGNNNKFGYQTVHRALRAGLIRHEPKTARKGQYSLYLTELGERVLRAPAPECP